MPNRLKWLRETETINTLATRFFSKHQMRYFLLSVICFSWVAVIPFLGSCKKSSTTELVIQKDTVLVNVHDTVSRTDRYLGHLDIDCVVGGCYYGSYNSALTTVTYYARDSTRYNIYTSSPGTNANYKFGFTISAGKDINGFISSIDMKGLDSLRYYVHERITGMGTPTYDFRGTLMH